jgi:hypothetical protein
VGIIMRIIRRRWVGAGRGLCAGLSSEIKFHFPRYTK